MSRFGRLLAFGVLATANFASAAPLVNVPHYDGKFGWIKLGTVPLSTAKVLSHSNTIIVILSVPRPIKVKKDKSGYEWFTILLADQGPDWKWNQTKRSGSVPVHGGVIAPGLYKVAIPLQGIPGAVLRDRKQTVSLGPNTSGLSSPASFTVEKFEGR